MNKVVADFGAKGTSSGQKSEFTLFLGEDTLMVPTHIVSIYDHVACSSAIFNCKIN